MSFNVGDKVSVLDDDLTGRIVKVLKHTITVVTEDGFELDFSAKELVVLKNEKKFKVDMFSKVAYQDVLNEKETKRKHTNKSKKSKERYLPTMEVDLHIHQLTDKPRRMNNHDMLTMQLDTARRQLEFAIKKRVQKIVFIHGVGEGILKIELEYLFGRYNNLKYYDADYKKYGVGATEVYVFQNPSQEN